MVLQIIYRWREIHKGQELPRILITAPSNAAVDEIVRKLVDCRKKLKQEEKFRLVRIGTSAIHPEAQPYELDNQIEGYLRHKNIQTSNEGSLILQVRESLSRINAMTRKMEKSTNQEEIQMIHRSIKGEISNKERAQKQLNELKDAMVNKTEDPKEKDRAREELLLGADIVAATLNSTRNGQMESFFIKKSWRFIDPKRYRPFDICIMDEASQCVEPEALIPLRLGFAKLVMVGDPAQLPATVSSMAAKEQSFSTSLFARLFKHFEFAEPCPVQHLVVQYRMASEIMTWPNQYFYGGKLRLGDQQRQFPLNNYLVRPVLIFMLTCFNFAFLFQS